MWELFLRQLQGPDRLVFAECKLPHISSDLTPQRGPNKLVLSPGKIYFALYCALWLPITVLSIFKLCNGEEKIGGKTKKWETSKGPARGKEKTKLQNKATANSQKTTTRFLCLSLICLSIFLSVSTSLFLKHTSINLLSTKNLSIISLLMIYLLIIYLSLM